MMLALGLSQARRKWYRWCRPKFFPAGAREFRTVRFPGIVFDFWYRMLFFPDTSFLPEQVATQGPVCLREAFWNG